MKVKYIANDGKEFDSLNACEKYEKNLIEGTDLFKLIKENIDEFSLSDESDNCFIIYEFDLYKFITSHKTELLTILSK